MVLDIHTLNVHMHMCDGPYLDTVQSKGKEEKRNQGLKVGYSYAATSGTELLESRNSKPEPGLQVVIEIHLSRSEDRT